MDVRKITTTVALAIVCVVLIVWALDASRDPRPRAEQDAYSAAAIEADDHESAVRRASSSDSTTDEVGEDDLQSAAETGPSAPARGELQREFGPLATTDLQRRLLEQLDTAIAKNPDGSFRSPSAETYYPPETLEIDHYVGLYCDGKDVLLLPGDVASIEAAIDDMRRLETTAKEAKREFFRSLARSVVDRVWEDPPETSVREHGRTAAVQSQLDQIESLNERFGARNRDYFTATLFNEHGTVTLVTFRAREPRLFSMTDQVMDTYRTTHRTVRGILRRY